MDDIAKLGLDLDTRKLRTATKDLDSFQKKTAEIENTASRLEGVWGKMARQVGGLAAGLGLAFSVVKIIQYGDAWATVTNQLRLATTGVEELKRAQEGVYAIAQKTFSSLDATASLTSKLNRYASDLTGGLEGTLKLVETINKASALGGTAAASQAAGLFQLNQALASGTLRGEELNSVMEQTPIIARAIADGLGLTIGEMRKVAAQGKITSDIVVKAMQDQADEIDAAFASLEPTVAMSLTKLQNSLTKMVGQAGAPIFEELAQGISKLADAIGSTGSIEAMSVALKALFDSLSALASLVPAVAAAFGAMFVVRSLAPLFVALDFAMQGAAGRALVMDRAMQLASAGMIGTRAAATGLITALGGPWAVGLGAAAAAMVFFGGEAAKARQELEDFFKAADGDAVNRAVNEIRGFKLKLGDANPAVRQEAFKGLQDNLSAAEDRMSRAIKTMGALQAKYDQLKADLSQPNTDHGLQMRAIIQGRIDEVLPQVEDARRAAKNYTDAYYAALNETRNPSAGGTKEKKRDVFGLLTGGDAEKEAKEAAARLKKFVDTYVKALTDLTDAQAERQGMLDEMSAVDALAEEAKAAGWTTAEFERQLDILIETSQLLGGPMAAAYKFLGEQARATARADAEALAISRRKEAADRAQLKISQDLSRLPRLAASLAVSPAEYDLTKLTFELYDDGVALTEEAARAEALKMMAVERTSRAIEDQADRARDLAEAPAQNWLDGLTRLSDDFWTDWVEKGWGAFDDLGDGLKGLWKKLQADALRLAFEPMRNAFMGSMGYPGGGGGGGVAGGAGAPVGPMGGGGNPFGAGGGAGVPSYWNQIANAGGPGAPGAGAGGFSMSGMGSVLRMALASQGGDNGLGLGMMNGGNWMGREVAVGLGNIMGQSAATGLGNAIGNVFNPGSAMGGMMGSGLASLLGFNGKNSDIGGTIGGIAGSFIPIPVLGPMIGSFIGKTIGSLIGPQASDQGAVAGLDGMGRVTSMTGGKRTAETEGATREAADAIGQAQKLLKELGATLGVTVDQLVLGTRDQSRFSLTGSNALISSGTTGDPKALVNAAMRAVLDAAQFTSPALQGVADAMMGAGRSFEDTLQVLGDLADILPDTSEPLSQWGEALKALNETFQDLRTSTAGVAAAALEAAEAQARGALRDDFNEAISDALMQAREPLKKQFGELLESQMERITDATALGANLADVLALNSEELAIFIEGAANSADVFSDLNEQFAALRAQAIGLGQDVSKMDAAFAKARDQIVASFNDGVSDELDRLSNPTLATLKAMLEGQKNRLDQAKALGANLAAVERLNALESQRFFEGLNDDQFRALGDYLGLVEDFTGRIGSTLVQLRDELDDEIAGFDKRRQDLESQENAWRQGGQALLDLRTTLLDRFSDLSPQASLDDLRGRFGRLTEDARAGNASAIAALPQVADQLVSRSRELFGSTRDFRNDLEGVTRVLEEIGNGGIGRADRIGGQLETLEQQRDTLIEIRDLLSQADPQAEALTSALGKIGEGSDAVSALLKQYLELQAAAAGQRLPNGQIANAALAAAAPIAPNGPTAPAPGSYAPLPIGGTTLERSTPAPATPPQASGGSGDSLAAEAIAELIAVQRQAAAKQSRDMADLRHEFRRLGESVLVAA